MANKWASFHPESGGKEEKSEVSHHVTPDTVSFQGVKVSDSERIDSLTRVDKGLAALDKLIHAGKPSEVNETAGGIIQDCREAVANHKAYSAEVTLGNAAEAAPSTPGMGMGSSASGSGSDDE